jgi:hypothetical protein
MGFDPVAVPQSGSDDCSYQRPSFVQRVIGLRADHTLGATFPSKQSHHSTLVNKC